MLVRNPSDTIDMIHAEVDRLIWRVTAADKSIAMLDRAIAQRESIEEFAARRLASDAQVLRALADQFDRCRAKLTESVSA